MVKRTGKNHFIMNKTTSSWCALFGIASANLIIYGFYVVLGINTIMVSPADIYLARQGIDWNDVF